MSFLRSSTHPSPADEADAGAAVAARLEHVLVTLLAAQAELDALNEGLAAVRLDAAIEVVKAALVSAR